MTIKSSLQLSIPIVNGPFRHEKEFNPFDMGVLKYNYSDNLRAKKMLFICTGSAVNGALSSLTLLSV